jgi:hypothetical protein
MTPVDSGSSYQASPHSWVSSECLGLSVLVSRGLSGGFHLLRNESTPMRNLVEGAASLIIKSLTVKKSD